MNSYLTGDSGLISLSGFAYQIRVFMYYLSKIREGMQVEFETLEDINIKEFKSIEDIDNSISNIRTKESNNAIQVKRTSLTDSNNLKILYNWLIIEKTDNTISKYILFTDEAYGNKEDIFNIDKRTFFEEIRNSSKKSTALISRVKCLYDNFEEFEIAFFSIKEKYEFISISDVDSEILNNFSYLFHKAALSESVYINRVKELLAYVTTEIINSSNNRKAFILEYRDLICKIHEICDRINPKLMIKNFHQFRKANHIDYNDFVLGSREYNQLVYCDLRKNLIDSHLMYKSYYEDFKFLCMEDNKVETFEAIEYTTYDNFENVKYLLETREEDTPYNRLNELKSARNDSAYNQYLSYGSSIHLTGKDVDPEMQISWKDEEDEQI